MARNRSNFKSTTKPGKAIDAFIYWVLFPAQAILLGAKLADPRLMSWWVVFIPMFILCVPLLLIVFGLTAASRGSHR